MSHEAAHGHHHEAPPEPKEVRIGYDGEDKTLTVRHPEGHLVQFFPENDQDAFFMSHALQNPDSLSHRNLPKGLAAMKARLLELGWNFDDPFSIALEPGAPRHADEHDEHDTHQDEHSHEQDVHTERQEELDDTQETHKRRTAKQFMNSVGRAVFVGSKTIIKGTRHTGHVVGHAVSDTASKAFDATKESLGKALEVVKTNAGAALEDAKQLAADYKVDTEMTATSIKNNAIELKNNAKVILSPKNEYEALHEAISILFQPLGDDERDAALQEFREKRYRRWTDKDASDKEKAERKEIAKWARARLKAIALKNKRLRQEAKQAERDEKLRQKIKQQYIKDRALNVVRIEDNAKVNLVIKDLRRYLAEKHPVEETLPDEDKAKDYYSGSVDSSGLLG